MPCRPASGGRLRCHVANVGGRTPTVRLTQSTSGSTTGSRSVSSSAVRATSSVAPTLKRMPSRLVAESSRMAAITRRSTSTPSPRRFVRGDKSCSSRYPWAACSSMPSNPAARAWAEEVRNAATRPSSSRPTSARGAVGRVAIARPTARPGRSSSLHPGFRGRDARAGVPPRRPRRGWRRRAAATARPPPAARLRGCCRAVAPTRVRRRCRHRSAWPPLRPPDAPSTRRRRSQGARSGQGHSHAPWPRCGWRGYPPDLERLGKGRLHPGSSPVAYMKRIQLLQPDLAGRQDRFAPPPDPRVSPRSSRAGDLT